MDARPPLSFEFFPPKTPEGMARLREVRTVLAAFAPEFCSVTYGAGGSTREPTLATVLMLHDAGASVAPHLSFGGDDAKGVERLLDSYRAAGIRRLVALRGDLPSGVGGSAQLVHANELVALIRRHSGDHFQIHVAAYPEIHPEARSYADDIHWLGQKFAAGADAAITQYFYSADSYFYFVDACRAAGIDRPIVPGIMPITNHESLVRFSARCGAEIPRWLQYRLAGWGDDLEGLRAFGIEVVARLGERLLAGGAPGLHFYTLNQAEATAAILRALGWPESA
ncbi:MAG: methylenetetrahydrofolate reductase [NAD(P)H] [Pseudomonadales bacterium]|nr:methylenetetrahydrofolate reductase [NAD(P)H] [Pseudomonadales bacterium]